ncbi:hypothetical protein TSACC_21699 [Terrimicrobium sacchariphilum]|uniref:Uncharacterized protein n=1 Tax=Terrimicrobium sacchariphilum TaxID=690879 RepID=A0A146G9L3_TERSA|nr:hypothetical protein [Terrimicrobium sacchariphilum]GAT33286.1 hypothetical protein TSACC_21699 [Terrimicrobium sacchariphilum]
MRINDPLKNPLAFEVISFFSSPKVSVKQPSQKAAKIPAAPNIVIPDPPAATPVAPPPSATNAEVQQAASDQRQQAASRKGVRATLIAGETGGFTPATPSAKKSLLG